MSERVVRVLLQPSLFGAETWNGIDEHLLLLCRYLDRRRFEPYVLRHPADGPQTELLAQRAGIRAIIAPYADGAGTLTRLRALRTLYTQEGIDLLHMHTPVVGAQIIPALAARLASVGATIVTYHQVQVHRLATRGRLLARLTHSRLIDETVAVSGGIRETLVAAAGISREQIEVVHNGVDEADRNVSRGPIPARRPGEVRLGYFGRLAYEKGVSILLEGLARASVSCPEVQLLIVGEGADRPELEALANSLGISNRVHFLGFRSDARRIMDEIDILVHVPRWEGLGLVVLEAMAAGVPVVANDSPGGLGEIVTHGETGIVTRTGDVEDIARSICELVRNPAERERLSHNGRARWASHFSAKAMADRTVHIYQAALARRRRAPAIS